MSERAPTAKVIDAANAALARSTFFARMSDRTRAALTAAGATVALQPGAALFFKGDPGDALYVVVEGEIEISTAAADGRMVRIAALGAGAVIGEMAVLDGGGRSADATATRRSRLMRIGRDSVLEALKGEPDALLALAVELSQRVRHADSALESAALLDLGGRLARVLLQEAGASRTVALPQTELARRIGASREKVNRKLSAWREEGWITIGRSGIRIEEPDALQSLLRAARTS
ncbi:MAG: Crp/Fnr family transcriptional regulator [Alphaproteobacteria bacterium]|nr:Crp/Fnr family transcriptional regulator [Alphaproteobacteria bacterium]